MSFLLQVFFMNHLPPAPENNIRVISNFLHLKDNFKKKRIFMLALLPKGV